MPHENSNVNTKQICSVPSDVNIKTTVLIVDDEEQIKELLIMIFEKAGYTVLTASSAYEAINLFTNNQESIELLVTDFSLQESNGCALAKILKTKNPVLNVLLMSGNPNWLLDEAEIAEFGFGIIEKPFDVKQLFEQIRLLKEGNSSCSANNNF